MLKLLIQPNPSNPIDVVFDSLADFVEQAIKEGQHFVIFPYTLSDYTSIKAGPVTAN